MKKLGFAEAFGKYGAKLKNVNWSVCATAPDGSLVVSLWSHHFRRADDGTLICSDTTERWSGPGKNEFRAALISALANDQIVRLVIATASDPRMVEAGGDASKVQKEFSVRTDLIGRVIEYDGERYAIQFSRD